MNIGNKKRATRPLQIRLSRDIAPNPTLHSGPDSFPVYGGDKMAPLGSPLQMETWLARELVVRERTLPYSSTTAPDVIDRGATDYHDMPVPLRGARRAEFYLAAQDSSESAADVVVAGTAPLAVSAKIAFANALGLARLSRLEMAEEELQRLN